MDAEQAVPVPDSHPDEIAAQTLVNPVTVLMLRRAAQQHFSVGFDGVVLNNAAASAVGRLFTAGAHHHQIVTISIVRNEARAEQLRDRFPEVPVVSADSPDWTARVPRRRFGTVDLRRARPPSGVKHPQTCCRAVQIADIAREQFRAAYRTSGLGLGFQHRTSQPASASIAAATSPLCPAPMTTASTRRAAPLLDGTGVLLLARSSPTARCIPVAGRHPEQLQAVRYPAQWTADGDLGHLHAAPAVGQIAQPHRDAGLGRRAHLRQQHQFSTDLAALARQSHR